MKKKILIATPIHTDQLILQYVNSIFQIINQGTLYEVNVSWRKGSLVNRVRNELVGHFLESPYEYIFFIDSDIVDFIDAFYKIVHHYLTLEKENPFLVMGAAYPIKHFHFDYVKNSSIFQKKNWTQLMLHYNINIDSDSSVTQEADKNGGIVEASSLGGGFMMFSKNVILNLIEKHPEYEYKNFKDDALLAKKNYNIFHSFIDNESKYYLSEDYGFCKRIIESGGKIYADITIPLSHYGSQVFHGSLYNTLQLNIENAPNLLEKDASNDQWK
jgi:hypothetical protein